MFTAEPFFNTLRTPTLESAAEMSGHAQPGSPAYQYADTRYHEWLAFGNQPHGSAPPSFKVTHNETSITFCQAHPITSPSCYKATDFVFHAQSQLLTDFSVNGLPLRARTFGQQAWDKDTCLWTRVEGANISAPSIEHPKSSLGPL